LTASVSPLNFEARFAELGDLRRAFDAELSSGGFFLRGVEGLAERQRCTLVLVHPDRPTRLELRAEAVWPAPDGVGLQLLDFSDELLGRLRGFVEGEGEAEAGERSTAPEAPKRRAGGNPHQRLRGLSLADQLRHARSGELQERVALERLYGKAVWETLLSNPRISIAEVARIARKGQVPLPLIEQIVANDGWLASAEVRRALLTNPRLRGRALRRVLSALPPAELKLVEQQTAYPSHVRMEARRLVIRR
jgi:hypothetical protein